MCVSRTKVKRRKRTMYLIENTISYGIVYGVQILKVDFF